MLAYVFWHWKQADIAADDYERRQRAFHAALASAPPVGYRQSRCVALPAAPWAATQGAVYEDWYVVADFAALGELNRAAVSGRRAAPHDAAATFAAGGAGGLYDLRLGNAAGLPRYAAWFGKPAGMTYSELFAALAPVAECVDGALWMRQMVLGPAREFCLHTPEPAVLPAAFDALSVPMRAVWPD